MRGYHFTYSDGTTVFIQHDDVYEGPWTHTEDTIYVIKDYPFYPKK